MQFLTAKRIANGGYVGETIKVYKEDAEVDAVKQDLC